MKQQSRRAKPAARAGVLIATIAAVLAWAAGPPADTWRGLMAALGAPTATANSDQLLVSSAAVAAWLGLGWLGVAVFLEVASVLPGAAGRGCAAVAAKTTPTLVRRIVQAAIGVSVLAGPLIAAPAFAAGPSTNTTTSTSVDRPNSAVASSPPETSPTPFALDRPATAFVPSAPPPATKRSPAGPAALVTGNAHRDAGEPSTDSTAGYVVRRGDTLWDIAARHLGPSASAVDISRAWPAWYDANRAVIGPDPSVIRPGELLSAPSASTASVSNR
jgi:nucleoid-associated protein YgaU